MIQAIPNTDPLFTDAARAVVSQQQSKCMFLQMEFGIGSGRAGNILAELEQANIIGPYDTGNDSRAILVSDLAQLEELLTGLLC